MVYNFLILSDEADNFVREISIDSDATFLDLQNAILDSVNYSNDQMTSFFLCDDDWEKKTEITLVEMDSDPEYDSWIMSETQLGELLEDEKQKLLFVFDYMTERAFFMELRNIQPTKSLAKAECTRAEGEPPTQIANFEDTLINQTASTFDYSAELYGSSDDFDPNEIDSEGYSDYDASEDSFGGGKDF